MPALATLADEARTALDLTQTLAREPIQVAQRGDLLDAYDRHVEQEADRLFGRTRLIRNRERLLSLESSLRGDLEEIADDLQSLAELRSTWKARRARWTELRRELQGEPGYRTELRKTIDDAIRLSRQVLEAIPPVQENRLRAQRTLLSMQERTTAILRTIDDVLAAQRLHRSERDAPPLYYAAAWDKPPREGNGLLEGTAAFWRRGWPLVVGYVLSMALVFALARTLRQRRTEQHLRVVVGSPVALAVFLPSAAFIRLSSPAPPVVELVAWVALGTSGLRMAWGALELRSARIGAMALAVAYPGLLIAESVGLSTPWLRLCTVVATMGLGASALWIARGSGPLVTALALASGIGLFGIALAQVLGFLGWARFLLGAMLDSAFILFLVLALLDLIRGTTAEMMVIQAIRSSHPWWRRIAAELGQRLGRLTEWVVMLSAVLVVLHTWELVPSPIETWESISTYSLRIFGLEMSLAQILGALLILYVARQSARVIEILLESALQRNMNVEDGVGHSIRTLARYAVMLLGSLLALGALGVGLGRLALVIGALGVGIGFGLQNIASDFVSGLILLFERPLRKGDALVIDDQWAVVKNIGLRSTLLGLIDESELVVPNSHLTSEKLRNWTLSGPSARLFIPVGVVYGSDIEAVFEILRAVADENSEVFDEPPSEVLFTEFGPHALMFELRVWLRSATTRLSTRSDLLREITRRFRAASIEIALPQRDLHLRTVSPAVLEALEKRLAPPEGGGTAATPPDRSPRRG